MATINCCRYDGKCVPLPLFDWADKKDRCARVSYPARWLCRRFPELDLGIAQLIGVHASLGAHGE